MDLGLVDRLAYLTNGALGNRVYYMQQVVRAVPNWRVCSSWTAAENVAGYFASGPPKSQHLMDDAAAREVFRNITATKTQKNVIAETVAAIAGTAGGSYDPGRENAIVLTLAAAYYASIVASRNAHRPRHDHMPWEVAMQTVKDMCTKLVSDDDQKDPLSDIAKHKNVTTLKCETFLHDAFTQETVRLKDLSDAAVRIAREIKTCKNKTVLLDACASELTNLDVYDIAK